MSKFTSILLLALTGWKLVAAPQAETSPLVLYSGRGESLVGPLLARFTQQTGIDVQVRYAGTPELARLILEEGASSPADIFWAQDIGSMGPLHRAGLLTPLDGSFFQKLLPSFRPEVATWLPVSGRVRVLYYNPQKLSLPQDGVSLKDLTSPNYRNRVGWAPTNASFQLSVAAMLQVWGRDQTLRWLQEMKANGARAYANNTALLEAIAAGEIDLALSNHYYLPRALASRPNLPVASSAFKTGDAGNLLNFSSVGILRSSRNRQRAEKLLEFLISAEAQRYFVENTFEYPVIEGIDQPRSAPTIKDYRTKTPNFDYNRLDRIDDVLAVLREAEIL